MFGGTKPISVRFYDSRFLEPQDEGYSHIETQVLLNGQIPTGTLYFWKTFYEFNSSNTLLVDKRFLHNVSLPKIANVASEGTTVTKYFSQFAASRFETKHNLGGLFVLCYYFLYRKAQQ